MKQTRTLIYLRYSNNDNTFEIKTDKNFLKHIESLRNKEEFKKIKEANTILKSQKNAEYSVKPCEPVRDELSPMYGADYIASRTVHSGNAAVVAYGYGRGAIEALDNCMTNISNINVVVRGK